MLGRKNFRWADIRGLLSSTSLNRYLVHPTIHFPTPGQSLQQPVSSWKAAWRQKACCNATIRCIFWEYTYFTSTLNAFEHTFSTCTIVSHHTPWYTLSAITRLLPYGWGYTPLYHYQTTFLWMRTQRLCHLLYGWGHTFSTITRLLLYG